MGLENFYKPNQTWVYKYCNILYISDQPLDIKGAKQLASDKLQRTDIGLNMLCRYYRNGEHKYSRLGNLCRPYIVEFNNEFYLIAEPGFIYHNVDGYKFKKISDEMFAYLLLKVRWHHHLFN